VLEEHHVRWQGDLTADDVLAADAWARAQTLNQLKDPTR
jgi:hypothetical protein